MPKAALATIALGSIGGLAYFATSDNTEKQSSETFLKAQDFTPMGEFELEFMKFVAKYGRHFGTREEYSARYQIFEENFKLIQETQKEVTHQLDVNQFADWTKEEFRAMTTGFQQSGSETVDFPKNPVEQPLPASVDWRAKGGVSPIINQGQCGSSWAFSATEALEGRYFAKHGVLYTLSAQQLLDCENKYSYGCNGGQMYGAFEYAETNPIETVEDYPYVSTEGQHFDCKAVKKLGKATVESYAFIQKGSAHDFKKQLLDGPVSTAIDAASIALQYYKGGIVTKGCQYNPDHGIAAVGYGVENGTEYLILKNTWGETWGEKGYVRVGLEDGKGVCGVNQYAVYPIMK